MIAPAHEGEFAATQIVAVRLRLRRRGTGVDPGSSRTLPTEVRVVACPRPFGWRLRIEDDAGTLFDNYQACSAGSLTGNELAGLLASARVADTGLPLLPGASSDPTGRDIVALEVHSPQFPEIAALLGDLPRGAASAGRRGLDPSADPVRTELRTPKSSLISHAADPMVPA